MKIRVLILPLLIALAVLAVGCGLLREPEEAGRATAAVEREAFGLTIPQVRNVANVEEAVVLVIDFVARA